MLHGNDAEQLIAKKSLGQDSGGLGMKYPLALWAPLDIQQHKLFFSFQGLGIEHSALTRTFVPERSSAVGTVIRQMDVQDLIGFILLQWLPTVSLVPVSGTSLERLVLLKAVCFNGNQGGRGACSKWAFLGCAPLIAQLGFYQPQLFLQPVDLLLLLKARSAVVQAIFTCIAPFRSRVSPCLLGPVTENHLCAGFRKQMLNAPAVGNSLAQGIDRLCRNIETATAISIFI